MEQVEEPFESVFEAILKKTEVKTPKSQKRTKRVTQKQSFSDSKPSSDSPRTDDSETPHPWRIAWIKKAKRSNNDLLNAYVSFDSGILTRREQQPTSIRVWKDRLVQSESTLVGIDVKPIGSSETTTLAVKPVERKRAKSLDSLWTHSWDITPFYFDEAKWKEKRNTRRASFWDGPRIDDDDDEEDVEPTTPKDPYELRPTVSSAALQRTPLSMSYSETVLVYEEDGVHVRSGLVENLFHHMLYVNDEEYTSDFILSLKKLMPAKEFFQRLQDAFEEKLETKYPKLQSRVVNVIKMWLQLCYEDFLDPELFDKLEPFFQIASTATSVGHHWVSVLRAIIQEKHPTPLPPNQTLLRDLVVLEGRLKRKDCKLQPHVVKKKGKYFRSYLGVELVDWLMEQLNFKERKEAIQIGNKMMQEQLLFSMTSKVTDFREENFYRLRSGYFVPVVAPKPLVPKTIDFHLSILSMHPQEVARQLTLISEKYFAQISPREMYELSSWADSSERKAPGGSKVAKLAARCNQVTSWVSTEIVLSPNLSQRKATIQRFLLICKFCKELQNYCDMVSILGGLNNVSVQRLTKTWKDIGGKAKKLFHKLDQLTPANPRALRELHKSAAPPVVPFFGLALGDMIRLEESPDTLPNGHVNFHKRRVEASIFKEMLRFRSVKYELTPVPEYQQYLTTGILVVSDDDVLFKHSLNCESGKKKDH